MAEKTYMAVRDRYQECVRMLNGLEKTLERKLPASDRRWHVAEGHVPYGSDSELCPRGWPQAPETLSERTGLWFQVSGKPTC